MMRRAATSTLQQVGSDPFRIVLAISLLALMVWVVLHSGSPAATPPPRLGSADVDFSGPAAVVISIDEDTPFDLPLDDATTPGGTSAGERAASGSSGGAGVRAGRGAQSGNAGSGSGTTRTPRPGGSTNTGGSTATPTPTGPVVTPPTSTPPTGTGTPGADPGTPGTPGTGTGADPALPLPELPVPLSPGGSGSSQGTGADATPPGLVRSLVNALDPVVVLDPADAPGLTPA